MSWAIGNIKQSGNHLLSGKKQAEQHPGEKKKFLSEHSQQSQCS